MCKVLILADDLTGALDTGVRFSDAGFRVSAAVDIRAVTEEKGAEVIALDMESRHDTPKRAAEKVCLAAVAAKASGCELIYKKVDSTLRGNVGSEIAALLGLFPGKYIAFAPAFPETGRTTKGGVQYMYGVPVSETGFGEDLRDPVSTSTLSEVIAATSRVSTVSIPVGGEPPPDAADKICCFDAGTDAELDEIARRLSGSGNLEIAAGSAGFAGAICRVLYDKKTPARRSVPAGRTLIVCGSINDAATGQLRAAEKEGLACVTLGRREVFAPRGQVASCCREIEAKLRRLMDKRGVAALRTFGEARCENAQEVAARMPELLGTLAASTVGNGGADVLIVLGGDTMKGVMEGLRCRALTPLGELAPGIVEARAEGGSFSGSVIALSGSFGGRRFIPDLAARRL